MTTGARQPAIARQTGSSSQAALEEMLASVDEQVEAQAAWNDEAQARRAEAEARLLARASELL